MSELSEQLHLTVAQPEDIPAVAVDMLWCRSGWRAEGQSLMPQEFSDLYQIKDDTTTSYAASHIKDYNGYPESDTHIVDLNGKGELVGWGYVRRDVDPVSLNQTGEPFVGYTYTETDFIRQGYGKRRLLAMNMASMAVHGLPLHSARSKPQPKAERLWKTLVAEGLAIAYDADDNSYDPHRTRYVMR